MITRHTHPKARPQTPGPAPAAATGIAYLQLAADAHHHQVANDECVGLHALYSQILGQIPGQLPLDDLTSMTSPPLTRSPVTRNGR